MLHIHMLCFSVTCMNHLLPGNCNNCIGDFLKREGTCHQQSSCFREQYYDFINMVRTHTVKQDYNKGQG